MARVAGVLWGSVVVFCILSSITSISAFDFTVLTTGVEDVTLDVSPNTITFAQGENITLTLQFSTSVPESILIGITAPSEYPDDGMLIFPSEVYVGSAPVEVQVHATEGGNADLQFKQLSGNGTVEVTNLNDLYVHIFVVRSSGLRWFNSIIGWVYFVAWSVSFYPQIFYNFQRGSVVGLNFDFLAYNLLGFSVYSAYNIGLYWITPIQELYYDKHPGQLIPVQLNDVIFAMHATAVTAFTVGQTFFLQSGDQKVSKPCWVFIAGSFVTIIVLSILAGVHGNGFSWLSFLYWVAYIKLVISFIKYLPQVYMNYKRQCTVGWSIGNVILDCTGGTLSILQAVLVSYNGNDWPSLYADPVKFGLGFFSIFFDIIFMIQHYVLYRHNREDVWSPRLSKTYAVFENAADAGSDEHFNPVSNVSPVQS